MPDGGDYVVPDLGLSPDLIDVLVNLLVVVKVQQLNIELLWDAYSSGNPSAVGLREVRETNLKITNSMEKVITAIAAKKAPGAGTPPVTSQA